MEMWEVIKRVNSQNRWSQYFATLKSLKPLDDVNSQQLQSNDGLKSSLNSSKINP